MSKIISLIKTIPHSLLVQFADETNVNKFSKKLQGELVFKLLLYCLLTEKETSLRGMQCALETSVFKSFANLSTSSQISHSSISERLSVIEVTYFERIFKHCVKAYKAKINNADENLIRFDSTIVTLSSKLLSVGYNLKGTDCEGLRLLKFTIGYNSIPEAVFFYKDQTDNSENVALRKSIIAHHTNERKEIKIFDRGITSRANYDLFTDNNIWFISRIATNAKQSVVTVNKHKKYIATDTLLIKKDSWVYLYAEGNKKSKHQVRIIDATKTANNESISFVTNIENLSPTELTDMYKSRWEIEVFFKFIKQHLNFSHLVSRNENGIKVMLYVTMIAAILLLQYKQEQKLTGYKMVKKRFAAALETDIIYNVVIMCGGNAKKAKEILYPNST